MKLTDIMFDLNYIAANTGATWSRKADLFTTESLTSNASGVITLKYAPVPVQGNTAYVMYKKASDGEGEYRKIAYSSNKQVTLPAGYESQNICVLYRYTNEFADTITISSQFIPDTVHAVLTMALYAGDSCNIGVSTNKIGEITVDIPRFQLSGSQELSMTAAGASQTSLDGTALASGCASCDGKPSYATISRILLDQSVDNISGLVVEDGNFTLDANHTSKEMYAYVAFTGGGVPRKLANSEVAWSSSAPTTASVSGNVVSKASQTGTATITATATFYGTQYTGTCTATVQ